MKIKKKRKITKEELRRDKIEEAILSFFDFFKKEPKKWGGIVLIALVIFVLIIFVTQKRISKSFQGEKLFIQALTFLNAGEVQRAQEIFKQVYDVSKNSFEGKKSIYYLGHISFLKGDMNQAERYFFEYISSKPNDALLESAALEALSTIYFMRKEKDKSIKYIDNAIKKAPFKFQKSYYFLRKIEILKELEENKKIILDIIKENENLWKDSPFKEEINNISEYIEGTISAKGG